MNQWSAINSATEIEKLSGIWNDPVKNQNMNKVLEKLIVLINPPILLNCGRVSNDSHERRGDEVPKNRLL